MEKVEINELVNSAAAAAQVGLNGNDRLDILTDCHDADGLYVMADPARITQVLANILNNAIKFSDTGSIKISTKKDSSRKEVCVQIEDSGRGISKEIMPKLFTKFATTSSTDATKGGTGLGLHLSSKIIEAHGGRIQAYNKTGSGATFEIILPNMTREGKKIENPVLIHS